MSASVPTDNVLAPEDLARFRQRGWLRLREAFPPEAAERMRAFMWEQLRLRHGADAQDPSTWRWAVNGLNRSARNPIYDGVASPRLRGAIGQLFDGANWKVPEKWGGFLVDAPSGADSEWTIPADGWHWDARPHAARPLFVFTLYSALRPREGGTLLVEGSHALVRRFLATEPTAGRREAAMKKAFNRSHPWLARLTDATPSANDRVAEFMTPSLDDQGLALRVVEITGEPGDAYLCDGSIYHVRPTRIGPGPRFLCAKMVSIASERLAAE